MDVVIVRGSQDKTVGNVAAGLTPFPPVSAFKKHSIVTDDLFYFFLL